MSGEPRSVETVATKLARLAFTTTRDGITYRFTGFAAGRRGATTLYHYIATSSVGGAVRGTEFIGRVSTGEPDLNFTIVDTHQIAPATTYTTGSYVRLSSLLVAVENGCLKIMTENHVQLAECVMPDTANQHVPALISTAVNAFKVLKKMTETPQALIALYNANRISTTTQTGSTTVTNNIAGQAIYVG